MPANYFAAHTMTVVHVVAVNVAGLVAGPALHGRGEDLLAEDVAGDHGELLGSEVGAIPLVGHRTITGTFSKDFFSQGAVY